MLQVSGLFDPIVVDAIDEAIERADADGAQALVLQVNTRGAVVGRDEIEALMERIAAAPIPIAIWVGPSGARLYGTPAQLLAVADVTGMAPGRGSGTPACRCARTAWRSTSAPPNPPCVRARSGSATPASSACSSSASPTRASRRSATWSTPSTATRRTAGARDDRGAGARRRHRAPGHDDDRALRQARPRRPAVPHRRQPGRHLPAAADRPGLLVFEFFTAGVGIAGVVGAVAVVLACTGLATLPARGWAVGLILAAMLAFAVDVQVGVPRFWTGVGVVLTIVGSLWLFEPLPGVTLRPSWITLLAGIGGIVLAFVVGMPSMVRTRFATPTIGREWMIGELGEVVEAVDPDGVVSVGDARWRARTNRATPVAAGEQVRVVAIDGVTLEVEPLEGAARDHRERRPADRDETTARVGKPCVNAARGHCPASCASLP